jgi:hypothetical protein
MRRLQLFEFEDQPWLPASIRDSVTDFLQRGLILRLGVYRPVVPLLSRVMRQIGTSHVVDLCSGSAGPWSQLLEELDEREPVRVTLTDKYPNGLALAGLAGAGGGQLSYLPEPVDALDVPEHLKGLRTIFTGFHHFGPADARRILASAAEQRAAICVFEFTERSWKTVLTTPIVAPLAVFLTTPFARPLTLARLLWTYLVPVIPFVAAWDGVVSNLRTYLVDELRAMVSDAPAKDYAWEVGRLIAPGSRAPITYVLGYPAAPSPADLDSP